MKRSSILIIISVCAYVTVSAQSVGIGAKKFDPDQSAALEIQSNHKGLLIPRLTATDKNNIIDPAEGLLIYQTDETSGFYYFSGTQWYILNDALNYSDDDSDKTNEIQTLTLIDNTLSISGANAVELEKFQQQEYQALSLISDTLKITNSNYVLIPQPDGLGNHTALQNIQTSGYYISADGDDEGILINNDGTVSIFGRINLGANAVQSYELESNTITTDKIANGQVTKEKLSSDVPLGLSYKGTWDASSNNPNISSSIGINLEYYTVSTAGNINLGNGLISFYVDDWVIYNGSNWVKVGNSSSKVKNITNINSSTLDERIIQLEKINQKLIEQNNDLILRIENLEKTQLPEQK